jgi:hypothetical protein
VNGFHDGASARTGGNVREGVAIEFVEEGVLGVAEDDFELAVAMEGAGVVGGVEAFDEAGGGFGFAGDVSQANVGGGLSEADATAAAATSLEVTEVGEVIDDFDQVMARDLVGIGDFADGEVVLFAGSEHEDAEGVVGEEAEAHGNGGAMGGERGDGVQ